MRIVTLSPKEPGEIIPVTFEFRRLVKVIDSVVISVSVKSGSDLNPAGLLLGNAVITNAAVTQLIQQGLDDTAYLIKAIINSGNLKYSVAAYLLVQDLK